ncbi:16700_t:CDS:2 [Gigaspora rosea]|nr:16698_t:CDS:2 [Gigaspora rosea]CAG8534667.1 16700_t:CDS:2 [Gigaspora rosea]
MWSRGSSHSQLDDIWISSHIIAEISSPVISSPIGSTNSDHMILTTHWYYSINTALPRTKKSKHKIFLYDRMNDETWMAFSDMITQVLIKDNIDVTLSITDSTTLNKQWHKLNLGIKNAANIHILFIMKQSSHYNAFSQRATDLHQGLKNLNKILKQATDPQLPISPQHLINTWNASIAATNKMTESCIPSINIENIAFSKLKRYSNFTTNGTRTQYTCTISKKAEEVITEPTEIKHEIAQYYKNWTRKNTPNELLREE